MAAATSMITIRAIADPWCIVMASTLLIGRARPGEHLGCPVSL
ncbi:hypothetical protein W823_26880 [Williamsia sp. D3]|nr:hypothetical protein W823_26880 [Williamsia sp. D3]